MQGSVNNSSNSSILSSSDIMFSVKQKLFRISSCSPYLAQAQSCYSIMFFLSCSWIAYDKEDFSGNQYVLEEGAYPDLSAMGCLPQTCLKSLRVLNIVSLERFG